MTDVIISRPGDRDDKPVLIELRCTEDDLALLKSHAPDNCVEDWWRGQLQALRMHRAPLNAHPVAVTAEQLAKALWDDIGTPPESNRRAPRGVARQQVSGGEIRDVSSYTWDQLRALGGESGGMYGYVLMRARELLRAAVR